MNLENNKESTIKFIPAKCPSCGGELRVPDDKDVVKCMYCGSDVILRDTSKVIIETHIDIDKTLILAKEAEKGKNFEEAYRYYTIILEQDPDNNVAWLGKGFTAGMQSTYYKLRIEEARNCIIKGVYNYEKINKPIPKEILEKGHEAIKAERQSRIDPILRNIARRYYFKLGGHIGNLAISSDWDYFKKMDIAGEAMRFYSETYILPADENERIPLVTESEMKAILIAYVKLMISWTNVEFPSNEYPSESLVKIRKSAVDMVKINLMESSELENDPELTRILDDYIEEAEKKEKCYIATATMGDHNHPCVVTLRRFRDEVLLISCMGIKLVNFYYRYSPVIAQIISQHNILKRISLWTIIRPFTFIARYTMKKNIQNK